MWVQSRRIPCRALLKSAYCCFQFRSSSPSPITSMWLSKQCCTKTFPIIGGITPTSYWQWTIHNSTSESDTCQNLSGSLYIWWTSVSCWTYFSLFWWEAKSLWSSSTSFKLMLWCRPPTYMNSRWITYWSRLSSKTGYRWTISHFSPRCKESLTVRAW